VLHPKKVGTLPVEGGDEEKQTNEIKTAIPLLETIDIQGKTITADALLIQRELARYLVEERRAHYHFTVKGNQKKRQAKSGRRLWDYQQNAESGQCRASASG